MCFKRFKHIGLINAIITLLLSLILFIPVASAATAYTLYENVSLVSGNANSSSINSANETAEAFTPTTGHSVALVNLMLKRVGNPGTVTISILQASSNVPTGVAIVSTTINGNNLSLSYTKTPVYFTETTLVTGQQYAIVVSAVAGDSSNYVLWQSIAAGTVHLGSESTNSGVSWSAVTPDYVYEVWGNPSLQIISANVFQGYLTTGDLLICMEHINTYAPYYGTTIPQQYFLIQFLSTDNTTVLASTPMTGWGDRPESIYMSPNLAAGITIGGGYYVRMICLDSSSANVTYELQGEDWKGTNLVYLDKWMIATAHNMGNYYSTTTSTVSYVDYVTGIGEVLNASGGAIFTNAISGIMNVRPSIFEYAESKATYPPSSGSSGQSANVIDLGSFQSAVGNTVYNDMSTLGDIFNVSARDMAGYLIGLVILGATLFALAGTVGGYEQMGGGAISILLVVGVPLLIMGAYIHAISAQMVAVFAFIMGGIFVLKFWAARI